MICDAEELFLDKRTVVRFLTELVIFFAECFHFSCLNNLIASVEIVILL